MQTLPIDWQLHDQVSHYAIDSGSMIRVRRAGKLLVKIDRREFLESLYVPRGDHFDDRLRERLETGGRLFCFVGGRGQGKTTLLHAIESDLARSSQTAAMKVIDVRKLAANDIPSSLPADGALQVFAQKLISTLQFMLFPRSDHFRLIAWLLAGEPDDSDDFDDHLAIPFLSATLTAQSLLREAVPSRGERTRLLTELLQDPSNRELYLSLEAELRHWIRPQHILQAAVSSAPTIALIIAYDNVDQLARGHQRAIFEYLQTLHHSLAGSVTTLISIRHETVRAVERSRHGGADSLTVLLAEPIDLPGVALPPHDDQHCQRVLERRFAYALDLTMKLPVANRPQAGSPEDVLTRCLVRIGQRLLKIGVVRLTNFNVRAFLSTYSGFISQLRQWLRWGTISPRAFAYSEHIDTLFYLWLFDAGVNHGIPLVDVVSLDRQRLAAAHAPPSVHHMLMTCVFNLTTAHTPGLPTPDGAATFAEVFKRMHVLGFTLAQVRGAAGDLSGEPGDAPRALCFVNSDPNPAELCEQSLDMLLLTPCGTELVTRVYSAIGYVWGRTYRYTPGGASPAREQFLQLSADERTARFYQYIISLAHEYIAMMSPIAAQLSRRHGDQWAKYYRSTFGINGHLQLERILDSATRFFRHRYRDAPESDPFAKVRRELTACFDGLHRHAGVATPIQFGGDVTRV